MVLDGRVADLLFKSGGRYYNIVNAKSTLEIDLSGGSSANGTAVIETSQVNNSLISSAVWTLEPVSGTPYVLIRDLITGSVLDVPGCSTTNGTHIQEWGANGNLQQEWMLVPIPGATQFSIQNVCSGLVLDVPSGSNVPGTYIQEWASNGGTQQQWSLNSTPPFNIVNSAIDETMDVPSDSQVNGTHIQEWAINGNAQQTWGFVPIPATPYFNIRNNGTHLVLDVPGDSGTPGTAIQQWAADGGIQQEWQLVPDSNVEWGYFIKNVGTGQVLDGRNTSTVEQQVQSLAATAWLFTVPPAPNTTSVSVNLADPHLAQEPVTATASCGGTIYTSTTIQSGSGALLNILIPDGSDCTISVMGNDLVASPTSQTLNNVQPGNYVGFTIVSGGGSCGGYPISNFACDGAPGFHASCASGHLICIP